MKINPSFFWSVVFPLWKLLDSRFEGAVGQYNEIHSLPYESVIPMHKSAHMVE